MTFSERMKDVIDQGVAASKEFAQKAGAKAQEFGERSILMLEIKQLENQAQKLISQLGNETYIAFAEKEQTAIFADNARIKIILEDLSKVKESIEAKEAEIREKKKT